MTHITTDYGAIDAEIVTEEVMMQRGMALYAGSTVAGYGSSDGVYYRVLARAEPRMDQNGFVVSWNFVPMPLAHRQG